MLTAKTPLKEIKKLIHPCNCAACNHGCTMGSGIFEKSQIKELSKFLNIDEKKLKEEYLEEVEIFAKKHLRPKQERKGKPYGKCIFYKDKCTIHKVKPLQCELSMSCKDYGNELMQWFFVNYLLDKDDPQSVREYLSYEITQNLIPGASAKELLDKDTLKKIQSYDLLR